MTAAPCHLVGSYPAPDAVTAFTQCCKNLGDKLDAVPDGEPGWRWNFTIGLVAKLATSHPALGPIWREYNADYSPKPAVAMPTEQVEALKSEIRRTDWSLGYSADAIASYATFLKLRDEDGVIAPSTRFQVCLPGMSSFAIFVKPDVQYLVEDLAYETLLKEVKEIVAAIPARDLAVQSDIASDYIKCEVQSDPQKYIVERKLREDFLPPEGESAVDRYAEQHARLLDLLPEDVAVGLHLCMGNINNKPVLAPDDGVGGMVNLVNAITRRMQRKAGLQWVHFGTLETWKETTYYEALNALEAKDATLYMGVVYPSDREGARERLAAVKKAVSGDRQIGVSPPCGLARTSQEGVESVFEIMRSFTTV